MLACLPVRWAGPASFRDNQKDFLQAGMMVRGIIRRTFQPAWTSPIFLMLIRSENIMTATCKSSAVAIAAPSISQALPERIILPDSFTKRRNTGMISSARVAIMRVTEAIMNIALAVCGCSLSVSFIPRCMSFVPKASVMLTSEEQSNKVVPIMSNMKTLSMPMKIDDAMMSSCPRSRIGTREKRNFVQTKRREVIGQLLMTHNVAASEAIAG